MAESIEQPERKLEDKEQRFADVYLTNPNKAYAAREAGYSALADRQIGYDVYNRPHVKAYIEKRLAEASISAAETTKIISDIASSNLTDYLVTVQVEETPRVKKGLQEIIDQLQLEIEIEQDFLRLAQDLKKYERKSSERRIREKTLLITRYTIELEKNPLSYRIVDGDPVLVDRQQLDLAKIAADKERGKVKSYKTLPGGGFAIEMYSALDASRDIAKMQGLYSKDNVLTIVEQPLFGEDEE